MLVFDVKTAGTTPTTVAFYFPSGAFAAPGAYATLENGAATSGTLTVTQPSTPAITLPLSLANGVVGTAYSQTLSASGGTGTYTYTLDSGSLPPGVTLSAAGVLSGAPTTAGAYSFVVRVTDSALVASTHPFSVTIGTGLAVATSRLPGATKGAIYSQSLAATGGSGSYTWRLASGTLPAGLAISTNGTILGIPTGGGVSSFTVQATDGANTALTATQTVSIAVASVVTITTSTLPNGSVGAAYSATLGAVGGLAPYTWALTTGSLPTGLLMSPDGVFSGSPAVSANYSLVLRATDAASNTATQTVSLYVGSGIVFGSPTLPNGVLNTPYSYTLSVQGGTSPYTWTLMAGALPSGITLSSTGVLSGTPTIAGSYAFQVKATDATSVVNTEIVTLLVASLPTITTASTLPSGQQGGPYSQTLTATGCSGACTWYIASGALPAGLSFSTSGAISGTSTASGTFNFVARATDSLSGVAMQSFNLTIGGTLAVSTATLPSGNIGVSYSQTLAATGGTAPYTWAVTSGSLPSGLTLTTAGLLSGTPTAPASYTFTLTVTDGVTATASQSYTVVIGSTFTITTATPLPTGSVGTPYSATFSAVGGTTPYASWTIVGGTIPSGLVWSSSSTTATLIGTPTTNGSYIFQVQVTDAVGGVATKLFSVTIGGSLAITTSPTLPTGTLNTPYSVTLAATGGTAPYTWSFYSGTMPAGLTLSAAGVLSGTPTAAISVSFVLKVTDSTSATATQPFTLLVNDSVTILSASTLPAGSYRTAYSYTLAAAGGTGYYTWSLTSGTLPPGLSLSTAGVLSGLPTLGGSYTFTIKATDTASTTASRTFTLAISSGLTITTTSPLSDATLGNSYYLTFGGSGGTGPYTWSLFSGTLPTGLALTSGGTLSGTPTVAGTFNFVIRLDDSATSLSTSSAYTLTVSSGTMASRAGVISQLATGGGWKTTLVIVNPSAGAAINVRVNFYGDDGTLLSLPVTVSVGRGSTSTTAGAVERMIAANGTLIIETEASATSTTTIGWADVRCSAAVSGYAIFRQKHGDNTESEGTAILDTRTPSDLLLPFDNLNTYSTGVALVNLATDTATVSVIYRDDTGAEITRDQLAIVANGHLAYSMPARLSTLNGRRGVAEFITNQNAGLTALGLRFNPTLNFTNLPVGVRP
jgi:hypothetical protein